MGANVIRSLTDLEAWKLWECHILKSLGYYQSQERFQKRKKIIISHYAEIKAHKCHKSLMKEQLWLSAIVGKTKFCAATLPLLRHCSHYRSDKEGCFRRHATPGSQQMRNTPLWPSCYYCFNHGRILNRTERHGDAANRTNANYYNSGNANSG